MSTYKTDQAWAATVSILKTARRFKSWFVTMLILGLASGAVAVVNASIYANQISRMEYVDPQGLVIITGWTYAAIGFMSLAGSLLLGWLITTLFARHAEVVYFSGPENVTRDRTNLA